jgi:hypothetical protein
MSIESGDGVVGVVRSGGIGRPRTAQIEYYMARKSTVVWGDSVSSIQPGKR